MKKKNNENLFSLLQNETFTAVDIKDDECVDVYDVTARDPQVFVQVESLQHRDVFVSWCRVVMYVDID